MEKKPQGPPAQPVPAEGKKDKNANPLLKNGVTNKDVIILACYQLFFRSSGLSSSISKPMVRFRSREQRTL